MKNLIFLAHLATTFYMVGVIWIVQILVYPSMGSAGAENYSAYHNLHTTRITPVVAPAMIIELLTAIYFVFDGGFETLDRRYFWVNLALVLIIWISTFALQVPRHEKLAQGFAGDVQSKLVLTNWIRTVAWTLRGALVLWIVWLKIK